MKKETNPNCPDNRGGKREGAGRKKMFNVQYQRRIPKEFVPKMDEFLNKLKNKIDFSLYQQLEKWIKDCETSAEIFKKEGMINSELSSSAMRQAYKNVLSTIENKTE